MKQKGNKSKCRINKIEVTQDTLTGGGGMAPFVRYIEKVGIEELPFKRFTANSAFYYCMVIAFFLFETYKEDVLEEVMPKGSYATTVRRKALDFAAKIISRGGQIILKVTQAVMDALKFDRLWERCNNPVPIVV